MDKEPQGSGEAAETSDSERIPVTVNSPSPPAEPEAPAEPETPEPEAAEPESTAPDKNPLPQPVVAPAPVIAPKKSRKKLWLLVGLLIILMAAGASAFLLTRDVSAPSPVVHKPAVKASTAKVAGLQLDPKKNYGDKYASGLLPVGDGKYVTDAAKQGYVYACSGYAGNLKAGGGGAGTRGPWFVNNNTEYDINKKAHVQGAVNWTPSFSMNVSGATRTVASNDLPNHVTGVFPIAAADPAYSYDRNPNKISAQNLSYALAANPAYGSPQCMGGQSGIMLTGVAIFSGFDAGGRDAGAWEVQDSCGGHPEKTGEYHYHTLSTCITDVGVSKVIGFALDGFPITGPKVGDKNFLTTADLDECHGIVSDITLDSKTVKTYHYVMTQDFPYSLSCFRAKPIDLAPAAGQQPARP
jgi:hypothetical protein